MVLFSGRSALLLVSALVALAVFSMRRSDTLAPVKGAGTPVVRSGVGAADTGAKDMPTEAVQSGVSSTANKTDAEEELIVYRIGWDAPLGRTNNQLLSILRALDQMFDTHGEFADFQGESYPAVLAVSGWALGVLTEFFFDGQWSSAAENLVPIIRLDQLEVSQRNKDFLLKLEAMKAFYYKSNPQVTKQRRRWVFQDLTRNFSQKNLESFHILQNLLKTMAEIDDNLVVNPDGTVKYMVVHVRWLEGGCLERIKQVTSKDECDMKPAYIKKILRFRGMLGRMPIVVISDMQQKDALAELQRDPEIGRQVIIPALDTTNFGRSSFIASDMVLAAKSDVFVGTRASTMAHVIGYMRIGNGADPQSNFVFVDQRSDEQLDVCGDCIFFCNSTAYPTQCP